MYEYKGRLMNARVNAFYIPGLISTLSITASMFLDVAIVGQMLGPVAMGAASLSLPLTMVFNMVYMLFGTGGEGFERFNLAIPRSVLEDACQRLLKAFGK